MQTLQVLQMKITSQGFQNNTNGGLYIAILKRWAQ